MDDEEVTFTAPGKVILFGEHAVVYGHPAIVMAINLRAQCTVSSSTNQEVTLELPNLHPENLFIFDEVTETFIEKDYNATPTRQDSFSYITKTILQQAKMKKSPYICVDSEIPSSVGLGSSAAVAVATSASLSAFMGLNFSLKEINEMSFKAEKITHGRPSGIDNSIATFGGIQYYKQKDFSKIEAANTPLYLVVVNSSIVRSTKKYVEHVAERVRSDPSKYKTVLQQIDDLTERARICLEKGEIPELGNLMNDNHKLLELLGVGNPTLSNLRKILEKNGSLGSKLTGAGGGGCVIGLFDEYNEADHAVIEIKKKGYQTFISDLSEKGVKRE